MHIHIQYNKHIWYRRLNAVPKSLNVWLLEIFTSTFIIFTNMLAIFTGWWLSNKKINHLVNCLYLLTFLFLPPTLQLSLSLCVCWNYEDSVDTNIGQKRGWLVYLYWSLFPKSLFKSTGFQNIFQSSKLSW